MWDTTPKRVLVEVESTDCEAALQFAALEARWRSCGVHLVHVVPAVRPTPAEPGRAIVLAEQLHGVGAAVLAGAGRRLEQLLAGQVPVSTELCHGSVVPMLVAESAHACVVVMQHGGEGFEEHTAALSVVSGVAAHAHVPVVAVPATWRSQGVPGVPVISAGVEDVDASVGVILAALEQASRMNAELRLVHGRGDSGGHGVYTSRAASAAESRLIHGELSTSFGELLAQWPAVPVGIIVDSGQPVDALVRQAADSTLLLVGRHHPRLQVGAHLGAVARAVMRRSSCPVMVVDPTTPESVARQPHRNLASVAIP